MPLQSDCLHHRSEQQGDPLPKQQAPATTEERRGEERTGSMGRKFEAEVAVMAEVVIKAFFFRREGSQVGAHHSIAGWLGAGAF